MLEDLEKIVPQATVNEGTYKGYKLMKGEVIDVLGGGSSVACNDVLKEWRGESLRNVKKVQWKEKTLYLGWVKKRRYYEADQVNTLGYGYNLEGTLI